MTAIVSKGLRHFYIWYLARVDQMNQTRSGLCLALHKYCETKDLHLDDRHALIKEQVMLFHSLHNTSAYPFGNTDWTPDNPARRAHVLRYAISPDLRQFYKDWVRLSSARRPGPGEEKFYKGLRENGLCCALEYWCEMRGISVATAMRIEHEQDYLLMSLYGTYYLPFDDNLEEYRATKGHNRNPKRNKHVRMFANA